MTFKHGLLALIIAVLAWMPAVAAEKGAAAYADLKGAYDKAKSGDCKAARPLLDKVIARKDFADLPETVRGSTHQLAMLCALQADDRVAAYRSAMAGTALASADEQLWHMRLWIEIGDKRNGAAVDTVKAMAGKNPEALNAVPFRWFGQLTRELRRNPDEKGARRQLLAALAADAYQPVEVTANGEPYRLEYAGMLADAGDKAAAAALVRQIEEPMLLMNASIDARLRDALPADFDFRAAAERKLAKAREVAASHAGSMAAVLEVTRYLRLMGRPEESLATLEAVRPDGPLAASFTDLDDQRNWWWDSMARSYEMLGRYDDVVKAYGQGIGAKEDGASNVSQTINLAFAQLAFGRFAKAVDRVADFEKGGYSASPYGLMQMRGVRGCARFLLGRAEEAKVDLAYVMAHDKDDPAMLAWISLCADDMDGAAASFIRRLDDSELRASALLELSDYDPPPPGQPISPFKAREEALKARPDVQAAIKRAGGTRRFHLQPGEF